MMGAPDRMDKEARKQEKREKKARRKKRTHDRPAFEERVGALI